MRVLVTRPEREAQDWVRALRAAGHEALALPLIRIAPVESGPALQEVRARLAAYTGLMFVSANAVDGFFQGTSAADLPTQAWATGPGTAQALLRAGVPVARIVVPGEHAPQYDSEALWSLVGAQLRPGARVLIVRGADGPATVSGDTAGVGRDWFAQQLRAAGAVPEFLVSYRRLCPVLDAEQQALAQQAAQDGTVWLFSSSESVRNLQANLPQQVWGATRAVATHARVAQAAREAGFGQVQVTRPALPDVLASIESSQ